MAAAAARLGAQLALGFYDTPETWEEGIIAQNLVGGRGYVYESMGTLQHAFRAPAYAFLLAAAYVAFGTAPLTAGLLHAVLGVAIAVAVYAVGRRVGGQAIGTVSGLLAATHPGLVAYSAKVHQLNLDALLMALAVLLAFRLRDGSRFDAAALGAVGGVALLSRPTMLPFVLLAALPTIESATWATRFRRFAIVAAVIGTIGLPWVVRNQFVVGSPTLTTGTGITLWIGNNAAATGSTTTADGRPILDLVPEMRDAVWGQSEVQQDRLFTEAAVRYMAEDPGRTVRSVSQRFALFWSFGPSTGASYPRWWLVAYQVYYWPLVLLAALGVASLLQRRDRAAAILLVLAPLSVALAQSIFYVDTRHRWVVEPIILVLSGLGVVAAARLIGLRHSSVGSVTARLFPPR